MSVKCIFVVTACGEDSHFEDQTDAWVHYFDMTHEHGESQVSLYRVLMSTTCLIGKDACDDEPTQQDTSNEGSQYSNPNITGEQK